MLVAFSFLVRGQSSVGSGQEGPLWRKAASTGLFHCAMPREILRRLSKRTRLAARGTWKSGFTGSFGGTHEWYLTPMNVSGHIPYNPHFDSTTGITTNDILWNFLLIPNRELEHVGQWNNRLSLARFSRPFLLGFGSYRRPCQPQSLF
jgi:hypothetical protein